MTTTATIDWNAWRARYDDMDFAEQRRFYDLVYDLHPGQGQFAADALLDFLAYIDGPLDIVELGGWDGGLARAILAERGDIQWRNYEISAAAVAASAGIGPGYRGIALGDWYWSEPHTCDLFVACHVLEHLRFADVLATFDATQCRWMFLQTPLADGPRSWDNYHGSHILEVGWGEIIAALEERGFRHLKERKIANVRCFGRRA